MSATATSASKVASVPTLSELEVAIDVVSPDGILKSIKRFTASFVAKAFTLTEARAKLAFGATRSGKSTVASAIHMVYGAYLCASVEGLSATDSLTYVKALSKDVKNDISAVEASVTSLDTVQSVLDDIERLEAKAQANAPIKVITTPLTELSMSVATAATQAKRDGVTLDDALAEATKALRAQWAN